MAAKVTAPGDLDEAMLTGLVKAAVKLNDAKGDPTKR